MTGYGDSRRANAAREDLAQFVGQEQVVGLVLLDDDGREQSVVEGQIIRVSQDSVVFRHSDLDEEVSLATVAKRVLDGSVLTYG
jgi:ribosome maturation factor RimP